MSVCKTCGVDSRFREINANASRSEVEKLEAKYLLNIQQAREANVRLRSNLNAQRYTIKVLRRHITTHCATPVEEESQP